MAKGNKKQLPNFSARHDIPDFLFLNATGQQRKPTESDAVAAANRDLYRTWLAFRKLNHYKVHLAALEVGKTAVKNADLKMLAARASLAALKPGNAMHPWFVETIARAGLIASPDPKHFDARRVSLLADDATLAVPLRVYEHSKPYLSPYVEKEHLKFKRKTIDDQAYASLPDLSQIFTSAGVYRFSEALRLGNIKAHKDTAPGPVKVYSEIAFSVMRMSDPDTVPFEKFKAESPMWLWMPDGTGQPIRQPSHRIGQVEDFFYLPRLGERPITQYYDYYMQNLSSRHDVISQLAGWARDGVRPKAIIYDFNSARTHCVRPYAKPAIQKSPEFHLVQPINGELRIGGDMVKSIGKIEIIKRGSDHAPDLEDWLRGYAMEFYLGRRHDGRKLYQHADGILYPPIDNDNFDARVEALGSIYSFKVARALDARYASAPAAILNDGCYNDKFEAHATHANGGFTKNLARRAFHDKRLPNEPIVKGGIDHYADFHFDMINAADPRHQVYGAKQVLKHARADYVRLELLDQFDPQIVQKFDGLAMPEDMFAALPLSSAGSTLKPLNRDAHCYGLFTAEQDIALPWGGGNQYTLGEFYHGNLKASGRYRLAISTDRIIQEEADKGQVPDHCHYWQLSRTIDVRLLSLFTGITHQADGRRIFNGGDFVPVFDGGDGTCQEVCFFLGLKRRMPEVMDGRHLCFYLPPYTTMHPFARALLGPGNYAALLKDHDALAAMGILAATSMPELKRKTLECRDLKRGNGIRPISFPEWQKSALLQRLVAA
jgi:hypothetical protein